MSFALPSDVLVTEHDAAGALPGRLSLVEPWTLGSAASFVNFSPQVVAALIARADREIAVAVCGPTPPDWRRDLP